MPFPAVHTRSGPPQLRRKPGWRVRKCALAKFQEPVSAPPALQWLQERTTLFGNWRTDGPRCNAESCPEVFEFVPERPVDLDRKTFFDSLRSAPRGSSAGPGGCTYEHLKLMLDDTDSQELLLATCNLLAQGKVLVVIGTALMGAWLTALTKPSGGVRGIATGCTVRRLVARTLAKQFMKVFEAECAPFQYALSTRAGTDCVGHLLRAATDANLNATILTVDGIGAYDHVLRSAMLGRLAAMPSARSLLPFVRMSYAQQSCYQWFDDGGEAREVTQAEGGEQGNPLMPLLFAIASRAHWRKLQRHFSLVNSCAHSWMICTSCVIQRE